MIKNMNYNDNYRPLEVVLNPGESIERAIKKLSKKIKKEGILDIVKSKRAYEKPSEKRRRKKKERQQVLRRIHLEQLMQEELYEKSLYNNKAKKRNKNNKENKEKSGE